MILEHLTLALSTLVLSLVLHWIAWSWGLFPPLSNRPFSRELSLRHVIGFGFIFVFFYMFFPSLLFSFLSRFRFMNLFNLFALSQLLSVLCIIPCYVTLLKGEPSGTFQSLWKKGPLKDIRLGLIFWLLAFPAATCVGQFAEMFNFWIFGESNIEQLAISHLKESMKHPFSFTITMVFIVLVAPCLEEFFFRGLLYNFFRARYTRLTTLLVTSLLFSIMHFSSAIGIGNLPILFSLFVLSLYLGYLYEQTRSLFAPIALHFAFNLISAVRIVLL